MHDCARQHTRSRQESGTVGGMPDTAPLAVDVPALTSLLDGRYGEVRNLVRKNLA